MAATQQTGSLRYWRELFATANNSIVFDILNHAITVAASDYPEEFSRQKTRILHSIQGLELAAAHQGLKEEEKAQPSAKPKAPVCIKIKFPSSDEKNKSIVKLKPCLEEVALDQPKVAKPVCVGKVKPMKMKPCLDDAAIEAKLEVTKRKLQDRYEEIGSSKRQKSIQILNYLPKKDFKLPTSATTKARAKKQGNPCVQSSARKRVTMKLGFSSLQSSRLVSATY